MSVSVIVIPLAPVIVVVPLNHLLSEQVVQSATDAMYWHHQKMMQQDTQDATFEFWQRM